MPVEQIKIVKDMKRSALDEVASLVEAIISIPNVRDKLNNILERNDCEPLDKQLLEEFAASATVDVDRIVVFDDDEDEYDDDEYEIEELNKPIPLWNKRAA